MDSTRGTNPKQSVRLDQIEFDAWIVGGGEVGWGSWLELWCMDMSTEVLPQDSRARICRWNAFLKFAVSLPCKKIVQLQYPKDVKAACISQYQYLRIQYTVLVNPKICKDVSVPPWKTNPFLFIVNPLSSFAYLESSMDDCHLKVLWSFLVRNHQP